MTAPVDWSWWRQCEVCGAELGQPCRTLTGARIVPGHGVSEFSELADRPHQGRQQRTGGTP